MTRAIGYLSVVLLGASALFISRFWLWPLPWSNRGLWDIQILSPNGDVLRRILRGTSFDVFDLVIWMGLIFAALTFAQWLVERMTK